MWQHVLYDMPRVFQMPLIIFHMPHGWLDALFPHFTSQSWHCSKTSTKVCPFWKINTIERFVLSPQHHLSRLFRDFISLNNRYINVKAKKKENLKQITCFFSITNSFQYHPNALYSNMFWYNHAVIRECTPSLNPLAAKLDYTYKFHSYFIWQFWNSQI